LRPGEDEKPSQVMLIHVLDGIEHVSVQGHQATESGANSLVTVLR
jgi:hypothetical protein